MIFGYATGKGNVLALAKQFPGTDACAAVLLSAYGTVPEDEFLIIDGITRAYKKAARKIIETLENIGTSEGSNDLIYAATKLTECCCKLHAEVWEMASLIGQGIYLSGIITYLTNKQFLLLPFGSGSAYIYSGGQLTPQGEVHPGPLVRNTIGGAKHWDPQCWQGARSDGMRLLLTSLPIENIPATTELICNHSGESSHPDTISMLIRQQLEAKADNLPTAVIEIRL